MIEKNKKRRAVLKVTLYIVVMLSCVYLEYLFFFVHVCLCWNGGGGF